MQPSNILHKDHDWPTVAGNLGKARNFFKAVFQKVLLFGAETWVVSPRMELALKSFISGSARRVTVTAAERVGREMVLPLPGGGHEGSRVHRRKDVYK